MQTCMAKITKKDFALLENEPMKLYRKNEVAGDI